jgi:hypothetical protein
MNILDHIMFKLGWVRLSHIVEHVEDCQYFIDEYMKLRAEMGLDNERITGNNIVPFKKR